MVSPPGGACAQNGPGFVAEAGSDNGNCETTWNKVSSSNWDEASGTATIVYGQTTGSNHPGWTATVLLTCDPSGGANLSPKMSQVNVNGASSDTLNFDFSFKTGAVCGAANPTPQPAGPNPNTPSPPGPQGNPPPSEEPPCGGGCAFLIIFFVGGAVYVAGTVAFYYVREGKRGAELVPHKEFWKDLPFLVRDGAVFLFTKIKGLVTGGGGGSGQATYQQV
jgi:hypothetical protein